MPLGGVVPCWVEESDAGQGSCYIMRQMIILENGLNPGVTCLD